jgi:hypothetical protein
MVILNKKVSLSVHIKEQYKIVKSAPPCVTWNTPPCKTNQTSSKNIHSKQSLCCNGKFSLWVKNVWEMNDGISNNIRTLADYRQNWILADCWIIKERFQLLSFEAKNNSPYRRKGNLSSSPPKVPNAYRHEFLSVFLYAVVSIPPLCFLGWDNNLKICFLDKIIKYH